MKVKILPPHGCDSSMLDEKGWVELPEEARVADVLKMIRCGKFRARILLVSVNGERTSPDRILHNGDIIGFFVPVSGG